MDVIQHIDLHQFEELFKSLYSELCSYANKYLNDLAAAEETVQEIFVKFWENRESWKVHSSAKAYLYTTTRNSCFNQIRHLKVKEAYKEHNQLQMAEEQYGVDETYEADELSEKIRGAIERMPEKRRRVFVLSRYDGLKYKEIAEKLQISIKTVENQMSSALKFLKEDLAEFLPLLCFWLFYGG